MSPGPPAPQAGLRVQLRKTGFCQEPLSSFFTMVSTWRAPPDWLDPEQTQEAMGVLEEEVSEGLEPCAVGWAGSLPCGLQTGKRTAMVTRNCGASPQPPGSAPIPGCHKHPLEPLSKGSDSGTPALWGPNLIFIGRDSFPSLMWQTQRGA